MQFGRERWTLDFAVEFICYWYFTESDAREFFFKWVKLGLRLICELYAAEEEKLLHKQKGHKTTDVQNLIIYSIDSDKCRFKIKYARI